MGREGAPNPTSETQPTNRQQESSPHTRDRRTLRATSSRPKRREQDWKIRKRWADAKESCGLISGVNTDRREKTPRDPWRRSGGREPEEGACAVVAPTWPGGAGEVLGPTGARPARWESQPPQAATGQQ